MAEMMVVPPIVSYIDRANQNYKKMKEDEKTKSCQFTAKEEEPDIYMEETKEPTAPVANNSQTLSQQLTAAKSPEEKR